MAELTVHRPCFLSKNASTGRSIQFVGRAEAADGVESSSSSSSRSVSYQYGAFMCVFKFRRSLALKVFLQGKDRKSVLCRGALEAINLVLGNQSFWALQDGNLRN